jgi:hypothetical protein
MPIASTADDQRVEPGVCHECDYDLLVQHERNKSDQDDEDQHPEQEDPWRRQLERIEFFGHEFRRLRLKAPATHYDTDVRSVKSSCAGTRRIWIKPPIELKLRYLSFAGCLQ